VFGLTDLHCNYKFLILSLYEKGKEGDEVSMQFMLDSKNEVSQ